MSNKQTYNLKFQKGQQVWAFNVDKVDPMPYTVVGWQIEDGKTYNSPDELRIIYKIIPKGYELANWRAFHESCLAESAEAAEAARLAFKNNTQEWWQE